MISIVNPITASIPTQLFILKASKNLSLSISFFWYINIKNRAINIKKK